LFKKNLQKQVSQAAKCRQWRRILCRILLWFCRFNETEHASTIICWI